MRIKYRNEFTLREHVLPKKYPVASFDPLPPPLEVLQLEKLREKGCIVEYNEPNWIKEERKNLEKFKKKEPLINDLHKLPREKKKKEQLAKFYSFLPKGM